MKNIGLLLLLLNIVNCGDEKAQKTTPYETTIEKNEALIKASEHGDIELVQYLIENSADINYKNNAGNTALIKASECGYADIIKFLIDAEANINIVGELGQTSLHWATYNGDLGVVTYIVENGSAGSEAPFMGSEAPFMGSEAPFTGADLNHKNNTGSTALDIAKKFGHTDIVEYLESLK